MTEDRSPRAPPSLHHKEVAALSADDAAALDRMTEEEARGLLRRCGGFGGLEAWIAGRRWKTAPGGWAVTGELQGWQFRIDLIPAGLRISASAPGGSAPAAWVVTR